MLFAEKLKINLIRDTLKSENDYVNNLLVSFNVPESIEDIGYIRYIGKEVGTNCSEFEDRLNKIKNKIKKTTRKVSEKSIKRREARHLKRNKQYKKVIQEANNGLGISQLKILKSDSSKVLLKPIFNAEGKMVFSKFDFAAHAGAKLKIKDKRALKNPDQILKQIEETNKKLKQLKEQGSEEKANELKSVMAWKNAFSKIDGKKVKDDADLLHKAIKRKKDKKRKSKQQWEDRKNKIENTLKHKQKKRIENINKKIVDKKNNKLKALTRKGRVIPGF